MTFGANSKMFVAWAQGAMGQGGSATAPGVLPVGYAGLSTDVIKVALYNDSASPSPDNTAARALTGYAATSSAWVATAEVIDTGGSNWPVGGQTLASKTTNVATNVFTFGAANLAGLGNVTITNAFGCLVYDNGITAGTGGIAKQGVCYNSFGTGQSVTAGTFTIVWNGSGIFTITV